MSPPREVSPEMALRALEATNRHFGGPAPIRLSWEDIVATFHEETSTIWGAVEELTPLLPNEIDGTLEIKWGHDDEGNFGSLPPNEGDGPDSENAVYHETVAFKSWDVVRTANAVYIVPHGNSGGPVAIWFTPYQPVG